MRLFVKSTFPADRKTIFELFLSEEFDKRLADHTGVVYRTLHSNHDGDIEIRKLSCESRNELPTIAAKAMGTKHLAYEQENRLDHKNTIIDWTVTIPRLASKVSVSGRTTVVDTANGCERTVDGEVNVKIPLIGSRIEKAILKSFETSYVKATEIVNGLLSEG